MIILKMKIYNNLDYSDDDDEERKEEDLDTNVIIPQITHINRYYLEQNHSNDDASFLWCLKDCYSHITRHITNCITYTCDTCFGFDAEYYE